MYTTCFCFITHTHTHIFFFRFLSHIDYYKILSTDPCAIQFSSVKSLSHVLLFATPWTAVSQAFLFITNTRSLLKLISIELVMPSNHLIPFSCLQFFPASGSFPMSQLLSSGGQNIGVSASVSVLPMNIRDWFPLGWTGWISWSPRDFQESSPTPQFKSTKSSALSFLYSPTHIYRRLLEKP